MVFHLVLRHLARCSLVSWHVDVRCNRYGCGSDSDCPPVWLNRSPVKSVRYRNTTFKTMLVLFLFAIILPLAYFLKKE